MKAERRGMEIFIPVVITLESLTEARMLISSLMVCEYALAKGGFAQSDRDFIKDLITKLTNECVEEL